MRDQPGRVVFAVDGVRRGVRREPARIEAAHVADPGDVGGTLEAQQAEGATMTPGIVYVWAVHAGELWIFLEWDKTL